MHDALIAPPSGVTPNDWLANTGASALSEPSLHAPPPSLRGRRSDVIIKFCTPPGLYPYTDHLLKLQQHLPATTSDSALARARCSFQGGSTPLRPGAWARLLDTHPDKAFSSYLVDGIKNGFRIGFNRCQPLGAVTRNMPSASAQQAVVTAYIDNEVTLGRLVGPLSPRSAARPPQSNRGRTKRAHPR